MKTKPITLILTLLFCLNGSVVAELDLTVNKFIPITVTYSLRNIQKALNDGNGNTYVCGNYRDSLIYGETKIGSLASNASGGGGFGGGTAQDIFIAKFKDKELIWIKSINGEARDFVYDMVIVNDSVYITGITNSKWLYFDSNKVIPKWRSTSPFCAKYSSEGNLIWFNQLYQSGGGEVRVKRKDSNLNVAGFATGNFGDPNFPFETKAFSVLLDKSGRKISEYTFSIPMADPSIRFGNENDFYVSSHFNRATYNHNNKVYSSNKPETLIFKSNRTKVEWVKQVGTSIVKYNGNNLVTDKNGNSYIYSAFRNDFFLGTKFLKAQSVYNSFISKINSSGNVDWVIQPKGKFVRLSGSIHPVTNNLILNGHVEGELKIKDKTYNLNNDVVLEINENAEIVDDYIIPSNAIITGMSMDKSSIFFYVKNLPEKLILDSKEYSNTSFDMGLFEFKFNTLEVPIEEIILEGSLFYGVKIKGEIGQRYEIQYTTDVIGNSWNHLGFLTLKEEEEIFVDKDGIEIEKRFYRALLRKR